jgi:hypothetical protein
MDTRKTRNKSYRGYVCLRVVAEKVRSYRHVKEAQDKHYDKKNISFFIYILLIHKIRLKKRKNT